jgi:phosphatidate phosphatase APP1
VCLWVLAPAGASPGASSIDDDEEIVLFDAVARADGNRWIVPIRGRVYEPEKTVVRKALFAAVLQEKYGIRETQNTARNFDERVRWFVVGGESAERFAVHIGEHSFDVGPSDSNGYVDESVAVPRQKGAMNTPLMVRAVLGRDDDRVFEAEIITPAADAVMVVSDIDDTIKVSHVEDSGKLLDYTFYRDYEATPGMVTLYRRWSDEGAVFHYVSSSPWQLYVPLRDFMATAGYPRGAMHLKHAHFTDGTIFNLFKKGSETKPAQIEALLERFAEHLFVMVGDSGEQDPEVYAALMRRHPEQVIRIYIRNVTGESRSDVRFQQAFAGLDDARWELFDEPGGLALPR